MIKLLPSYSTASQSILRILVDAQHPVKCDSQSHDPGNAAQACKEAGKGVPPEEGRQPKPGRAGKDQHRSHWHHCVLDVRRLSQIMENITKKTQVECLEVKTRVGDEKTLDGIRNIMMVHTCSLKC